MDEGSSEPDILEHEGRPRLPLLPSPGWRPSRGAGLVAVATLVAGLAVGYVVGHGQARGTVAGPAGPTTPAGRATGAAGSIVVVSPPASADFFGPALSQDAGTYSVQVGRDLELGIPVTNESGETVLLKSVRPVPLVSGVLRVLSWHWAPCGFDNDGIVPDTVALGPGATTWVTAVVQPLIACPAPAPLQFQVVYSVNRQQDEFNLPGFPDLTAVRYSGCPIPLNS